MGAHWQLCSTFHCYWYQCVTVPKMLNDTDTDTFIRYQIFSIPIPVLFSVPNFLDTGSETFFRYSILTIPVPRLFPVPNFSDTGSETFFRYQILPIPVPRLFSGTKFFRYRFRYHQKKWKIPGSGTYTVPVPIINLQNSKILATKIFSGTIPGTGNSRYRYVTLCCLTKLSLSASLLKSNGLKSEFIHDTIIEVCNHIVGGSLCIHVTRCANKKIVKAKRTYFLNSSELPEAYEP